MFDLHGNERLAEWKKIRDRIEIDQDPFQIVSDLWSSAPLVNAFLDSRNGIGWPDPWHLILDNRYDDLAICLGIVYTLQLTQRFMDAKYEIHMSINPQDNTPYFFVVVNESVVLNYGYRKVFAITDLQLVKSDIIWSMPQKP